MRQHNLLVGRGIALSCLVASLCGCGGRSETSLAGAAPETPDVGEAPDVTSEGPTVTGPTAGGSQATAPEPARQGDPPSECVAGSGSLGSELVWQRGAQLYGIVNAPFFAFSPDGTELTSPADEYALGNISYSTFDGTELERGETRVLGRDASWSRELRGSSAYGYPNDLRVVDLELEQVLLPLADTPLFARLSANGEYLFGLYCQDVPRLERRRISDGQVTVIDLGAQASPCTDEYYSGSSTRLVVSSSNDSAAFPTHRGNELALARFSTGTVSVQTLHDPSDLPSEWPPVDVPLELTLSPTGRQLATVDGTGVLRVWSYPELAQSLPDIQLGVTRSFRNCYCTPRNFAPVAWSPNARFLATADESGNAVVRRACDGSVVATMPPPRTTTTPDPTLDDRSHPGPAFLAFTPDGSGLAVLFISGGFGGTVAYYELTE